MAPGISLGLPVYNGGRHLVRALDTLLVQSFRDFELVISDNASTDDTQEICERYAAADPRIRYKRATTNRGAGWNFNRVAELARADLFAWAAHDDEWSPEFLENCRDLLLKRPEVVLCYSRFQTIDDDGQPHGQIGGAGCSGAAVRDRWNHMLRQWAPHASVYGVMRTAALRRTRGMLAFQSSDQVLMTELALQGEIVVLDQVLHRKRARRDNVFRTRAELLRMIGARQRRPWLLLRRNVVREQIAGLRHVSPEGVDARALTLDAWRAYASSRAWLSDGYEAAQMLLGAERVERIRSFLGRRMRGGQTA